MHRAYSVLEIKSADDEARIIRGIATTPTPDHLGDVVEPLGVEFDIPLQLLHHHDSRLPIGSVWLSKPTAAGIEFEARLPKVSEPPTLKERVDVAWGEIKHGLIRGVSVGFKALETARVDKGSGIRFLKSKILELSLVTIPANSEATITNIRSLDAAQRAALGRKPISLEPNPAGATAPRKSASPEGEMQRTLAEQISAFEAKRVEKAMRMEGIQEAAIAESRSKNEAERDEFDTLSRDIETIDEELKDLRRMETIKAAAATVVKAVTTPAESSALRMPSSSIVVKTPPKLEPGVKMARIWKIALVAKMDQERRADVAAAMYGADNELAVLFQKATVPAGTTVSPNWASALVAEESGAVADFADFLRAGGILRQFGTGNIPSLREIPFRAPLITQTEGGAAYWTGQGKAKPLTKGNFVRTHLEPLKVANIAVLTQESIRDSNPKSDVIVRDMLRAAILEEEDQAFIDPTNAGTTNIKPASITNGAATVASSGDDAAAIRLDVRSLIAVFTSAHNPPSSGVWIMSSASAAALGMLMNPLGQPEFGGMANLFGGTFMMMPVIVSDNVATDIVVLVNAKDVFLAREDGLRVDMSTEASLEMSDTPAHNSDTPTAASLVSMFQTNSVAIRAEETINWARRRDESVAYLTGVSWGGAVTAPTSS